MSELSDKVHKAECDFYQMFNDVNDGFAPKVYGTEIASKNKPGFIVMDDLSERCITFGMIRSATAAQFWNVAKKVAHFQAIAACKGKNYATKFNDNFHFDNFHSEFLDPTIGKLAELYPSKFSLNM
jgi:hypothetical protein